MNEAVKGLKPEQLDTRYRPEGWTVRQVVHHVPDSHMNAYMRFKLALTEDLPLIKPYNEAKWAELGDVRTARRSSLRSRCWRICTSAGCCCCARWVQRNGRASSAIRSGRNPCRSTIRSRCTRGTGNITSRTSHRCANAKDGGSAAENRKAKLENGKALSSRRTPKVSD